MTIHDISPSTWNLYQTIDDFIRQTSYGRLPARIIHQQLGFIRQIMTRNVIGFGVCTIDLQFQMFQWKQTFTESTRRGDIFIQTQSIMKHGAILGVWVMINQEMLGLHLVLDKETLYPINANHGAGIFTYIPG